MESNLMMAGNAEMVPVLQAAWASLLAEVCRAGWHGSAGIVVSIQDGVIQRDFSRPVEQRIRSAG